MRKAVGGRENIEIGCGQTVNPLEGMQRSKDSTTKTLMRCAESRLDLVGLRELSYKGVEVLKGGSRESN